MRLVSICIVILLEALLQSCSQQDVIGASTSVNAPPSQDLVAFKAKAKSLVESFDQACVGTDLDQERVVKFAQNDGWSKFSEAAIQGGGRRFWARRGPFKLEIIHQNEAVGVVIICSVSTIGQSLALDAAQAETRLVRELLEKNWKLSPIEFLLPTDIFESLPESIKSDGRIPDSYDQYRFAFAPMEASGNGNGIKFGYLWAGGEHRLMAVK